MRTCNYSSTLLGALLLALLAPAALAQRPDTTKAALALRQAEVIEARMGTQPDMRLARLEAARLRIRSAELRAPEDRVGVDCLKRAAGLLNEHDPAEAARLMGKAADRAAASGDIVVAAHAYLDAAYGLSHCRPSATPGRYDHSRQEVEQIRGWVESARLLSFSPYLTVAQREGITRRLGAGCTPE
jgi:hypothetical protein